MSAMAKLKDSSDEVIFGVSEIMLSDESTTYDVYASGSYGQQLIAEPPSKLAAEEMSEAFNCIRRLFLNCSSDLEVSVIASNLHKVIRRHGKN